MKRLFNYAKKYILELSLSSIGAFTFAFGYVMIIFYGFKILLNFDYINGTDIVMIIFWVIATGLGNAVEHYLGHDIAFKVLRDFRILVYEKVRQLGPSLLDNEDSSKLLKLIGKDIDSIEVFYAHTLVPIVRTITFMIGIFIFYLQVNLYISLCITIISICILLLSKHISSEEIEKSSMEYAIENSELNKILNQIVMGKNQIIQLGIESDFTKKVENSGLTLEKYKENKYNLHNKKNKLLNLFYLIGFIVIIILMFFTNKLNNETLPFIFIYPFIFEPYKSITKLKLSLSNGKIAANNLFRFLDEKNLVNNPKDNLKCKDKQVDININSLYFTYPNSQNVILEDVYLDFRFGDRIGIYGESGSGKSTLAKVLMKWYPYNSGNIKFNGIELNDLSIKQIRSLISYMPQNPDIFNLSLRDNLTMLNNNISDKEIYTVLESLNLMKRIDKLEKGIDTIVNDDMFSSGEKQRIDLARAILSNSQILILDEPLSNLDTKNEKLVLDYIEKIFEGTVIVISHRYEAFSICNKIYEIKDRKFKKIK